VVDVPAKLSARARVFSTGHGRKTDATDAHSVVVVAVRTPSLNQVAVDGELVALPLLSDHPRRLVWCRFACFRGRWPSWRRPRVCCGSSEVLQSC
jgi:hypothetical protein